MAQDLSAKKSDAISRLVDHAQRALATVLALQEYLAEMTDNGFAASGANAIVDADCVGANAHLNAAMVNAALTALNNVNLNAAQKTTVRQVLKVFNGPG